MPFGEVPQVLSGKAAEEQMQEALAQVGGRKL